MPLKYMMGMPKPNYVIGMAHGILFMVYIVLLLQVSTEYKWPIKNIAGIELSLFMFGDLIINSAWNGCNYQLLLPVLPTITDGSIF